MRINTDISYFSTDRTFVTRYDMHLLRAMIADHVMLLALFLLTDFWVAGCSKEGVNFANKFPYFVQFLAICRCLSSSQGLRRLDPCKLFELFIGTVKMT